MEIYSYSYVHAVRKTNIFSYFSSVYFFYLNIENTKVFIHTLVFKVIVAFGMSGLQMYMCLNGLHPHGTAVYLYI